MFAADLKRKWCRIRDISLLKSAKGNEISFPPRKLGQKTMMICRLHHVTSALPTTQSRSGLLGLEQDFIIEDDGRSGRPTQVPIP
jgi:hypothetical protein